MRKHVLKLLRRANVLRATKHLLGLIFALVLSTAVFTGCKAWRTISTTATYVQQNDSTKTTTTISTKTVEEYQGVKK